jgi:hypothetical protein
MRSRGFEAIGLPHLDAAYNYARWLTVPGGRSRSHNGDCVNLAERPFIAPIVL